MDVRAFLDAAAFYGAVSPLLLEREAEYCGLIAAVLGLREAGAVATSGGPPLLCLVAEEEQVVAAAVQGPRSLLITRAPEAAIWALAADLADRGISLASVSGPCEAAGVFACAWSQRTRQEPVLEATERIYCIREVAVPAVSGRAEVARREDYELLLGWWLAAAGDDNAAYVQRCIEEGKTLLWRDPAPVSMASLGRPTPHGIGIGGVYTPPEFRGRGYASAVVAALSQRQLDAGKHFCCLSADAADPTANHVYQRIGYRHVADRAGYRLC